MADTDQEKLYVCILKLLKTDDFEESKELCKIISKDLPYLETNNDVEYEDSYPIDDTAMQRLKSIAKKREDLRGLIPVYTVGDGSCLFRALSFLCFGHQNRHRELRVRCIREMALNSDRYLEDEELLENIKAEGNYIMETSKKANIRNVPESNAESGGTANDSTADEDEGRASEVEENVADETEDDHSLDDSGNADSSEYLVEVYFYNVVLQTCNENEFATFFHIQALAYILKRNIEIIYSDGRTDETGKLKQGLKSHFNCKLGTGQNKPPLKIMWILDKEHFVPLISAEVKEERDSGLGASSLDVSENNDSIDHDDQSLTPVHRSTPKKAKGDKTYEKAKVKKKAKEDSEDEKDDITTGRAMSKLKKLFPKYDMTKYLVKKNLSNTKIIESLTGPYQMADPKNIGIQKDATLKFISELIEVQFKIKWKTDDGSPERFNFYDFCNVERLKNAKGKTAHLKYDTRRAHVFTELYREVDEIKLLNEQAAAIEEVKRKEFFCPPVYVKVNGHGWFSILFSSHECKKVEDFEKEFFWMHESLRKFVAAAKKNNLPPNTDVDYLSITKAIGKPTLYWAVLEDTDFRPGDHLELHGIGKTQVYVGKANGGIMRRWITDDGSHSKKMMKCAEKISFMEKASFKVSILDGIQLVDARLLLARIKKEKHAVFLIQTFKKKNDLEKAEKKHREGKKFFSRSKVNRNIVPHEDIKDTWTPKKMEFGMNKS